MSKLSELNRKRRGIVFRIAGLKKNINILLTEEDIPLYEGERKDLEIAFRKLNNIYKQRNATWEHIKKNLK